MTKKSLLGAHGGQMRQPRRARAEVRFASALLAKSKGRTMPRGTVLPVMLLQRIRHRRALAGHHLNLAKLRSKKP